MSTGIQQAPTPGAHHGPTFKLYFMVGGALAVFTALSFVFNWMSRTPEEKPILSAQQAFALILAVAVCKTILVGMFFMHLKYDWGRLYFMIIPAFILGAMMMIVLLPDIVVAWHKDVREIPVSSSGTR